MLNSGLLDGAVALGSGGDSLTLTDGALLVGDADGGLGIDAFVLDGAGSYDGAFTAFESLTKTGSGTWRLNGGPSSATATQIVGGELAVNGTLASQVAVGSGAVLSGSGTIAGDVASSGGTVSPGSSIGTLTVTGNYTSDAAAALRAEIDDAGAGDRLAVGGTAQIDGALSIEPLAGDYRRGGKTYDLLVAGGGLTGEFATVTVSQPLKLVLEYLPDRVRLLTLRSDFAATGLTGNQRAVGRYLDAITPAPGTDLTAVFFALSSLGDAAVPDALDQLHPEVYDAYTSTSFASTRRLTLAAEDRIAELAKAARRPGKSAAESRVAQLAAAVPGSVATEEARAAISQRGGWVTASGSGISQDETDGHVGYDSRAFDLIAGIDGRILDRIVAGVAFDLSDAQIDWSNRGGDGDASGVAGALYLGYLGDRLHGEALAGYGHDWYDTERDITFGGIDRKARSDGEADRLFAAIGGGYTVFQQGGWTAEATAEFSYIHLAANAFEEEGAGSLNLEVDDRSEDSARLLLGGTVGHDLALTSHWTLSPHLTLGWAHEFIDGNRELVSGFSGLGTTFTVEGAEVPRNSLLVGTGVALSDQQTVALSFGYESEFASNRTSHAIAAHVALAF